MDVEHRAAIETITRARLEEDGVWHNIFKNHEARQAGSCREAVTIRDRLGAGGNGGVPLWVEVKREVGVFVSRVGDSKRYYAAHTRANKKFVRLEICGALGLDPELFSHVDNIGRHEEFFGLVNPLNVDVILAEYLDAAGCEVFQIFDKSLLIEEGFPATVTTNIGHYEYGMEIAPRDLIACVKRTFPHTSVADISVSDNIWLGLDLKHSDKGRDDWQRFPPPDGPKIGILTGNSPESGVTLWSDLLRSYRSLYTNTADVLMPDTMIHSLPAMGLSMELVRRSDAVWAQVERGARNLLESGCKLITVACNTTIYFQRQLDELCSTYDAQFVSIADACVEAIRYKFGERTAGLRVGLIGIGPVIDLAGGYSGYARPFKEAGIVANGCDGSSLAFTVKNIGTDKRRIHSATEKFRKLVRERLREEPVIVLSLTEISILYRDHIETAPKGESSAPRKTFIDPLWELAKLLVFKYVSGGLRQCELCGIPSEFPVEARVAEMVFGTEANRPEKLVAAPAPRESS